MIVDRPEHKELLLAIINKATFPGAILAEVLDLKVAVGNAKVAPVLKPAPKGEDQ